MNKITKKDRYAIEFLYLKKYSEDEIAKELDLNVSQVKRFINKNLIDQNTENTENTEKTTKKESPKNKTKNLMIRETAGKKNNSVSIMTQGASQISDEFYKNMNKSSKNTDNYIYRRPNE